MTEHQPLCVECLRLILESGQGSLEQNPGYAHVGTNHWYGSYRPEVAYYMIDGTYYCAMHALPIYQKYREDAQIHMIEESL